MCRLQQSTTTATLLKSKKRDVTAGKPETRFLPYYKVMESNELIQQSTMSTISSFLSRSHELLGGRRRCFHDTGERETFWALMKLRDGDIIWCRDEFF